MKRESQDETRMSMASEWTVLVVRPEDINAWCALLDCACMIVQLLLSFSWMVQPGFLLKWSLLFIICPYSLSSLSLSVEELRQKKSLYCWNVGYLHFLPLSSEFVQGGVLWSKDCFSYSSCYPALWSSLVLLPLADFLVDLTTNCSEWLLKWDY